MPRVALIQNREDVAPEHYAIFDELAALRGRISGPSSVVLHSPYLARPWNEISEYLHRDSIVEAQDAELAVAASARENDCPYIWAAHAPPARKAGVSDATITAVRDRGSLETLPASEAVIVRYVRQLLQDHRVDDGLFDALLQAHGPRWLVELTGWIGRYSALACILNTFEVEPGNENDPLPVDGAKASATPRPAPRAPHATPRLAPITSAAEVAEPDREVFEWVAKWSGRVPPSFGTLMYSPPLCKRVFDISDYFRVHSLVAARLRELAIIVTARESESPYVWGAHLPAARREGVSEAAIRAIRDRTAVAALAPDERDVIDFVRQVVVTHRVGDPLFERLREGYGVPWLVEMTALIGHYGVMSATANAFEIGPAAGAETLPSN